MHADEVARFLRDNPDFFVQHEALFTQLTVPHPQHNGQAISLAERQLHVLRDKIRQLEQKLAELIRFGEENDDISTRIHRLALALLEAASQDAVRQTLVSSLQEDFSVPYLALETWGLAGDASRLGEALCRQIEALPHPYCGAPDHIEVLACFGEAAPHVRSVALIPLRWQGAVFGMLVLGSPEAERFYAEMGTLYLARLGDLAAVALYAAQG